MRSSYRSPSDSTPEAHEIQAFLGGKRMSQARLKLRQNWELHGADNSQGLIYFLQGETGGPIKVGRTDWLVRRFVQIQTSSPEALSVTRAIPVGLTRLVAVERTILDRFADSHIRGEWFAPTPRLARLAWARDYTGQFLSGSCSNLYGVDSPPSGWDTLLSSVVGHGATNG